MEGKQVAPDEERFVVIFNDEEQQHCIWRSRHALPNGWRRASKEVSKAECIELIARIGAELTQLHALTHSE